VANAALFVVPREKAEKALLALVVGIIKVRNRYLVLEIYLAESLARTRAVAAARAVEIKHTNKGVAVEIKKVGTYSRWVGTKKI
jgi:hypothetical protein